MNPDVTSFVNEFLNSNGLFLAIFKIFTPMREDPKTFEKNIEVLTTKLKPFREQPKLDEIFERLEYLESFEFQESSDEVKTDVLTNLGINLCKAFEINFTVFLTQNK